jgi:ABC-type multidrug transport system ATPase subunit
MGSSGAGKTTLMDVLALRKSTGEVSGKILMNGHPQEEKSFRRCTGYVEQFDTQSPQLTIRETVEFSAQLRLDEKTTSSEAIPKFVDQVLYMLELTNLQDLQVGSDEEGGLSFEQRKRLSIAVEVAANPSILFLDEPTSGLVRSKITFFVARQSYLIGTHLVHLFFQDARAAAIVMRGMKRIASEGRAVCATIHQPSVAIFNDFNSLLLLKRGGEVVFHGDLGQHSENLIRYFERYDATPRIQPGENPATWMLTAIGAGSHATAGRPFDFAGCYAQSDLHKKCLQRIQELANEKSDANQVTYSSRYATSKDTQARAVFKRAFRIYFRSPAYNLTRVMVSFLVAMLFASVYASQRVPKSESDMNSRVNSVFIATLFLCVNAQNTVLAVFEFERNMYYRHKAAGMYRPSAVAMAFTFCEIPFVLLTSTMYVIPFYFIMGFDVDAGKFFLFYLFVTLGFCSFTFLGQMFVSLLRDAETAQVIGGVLVSTTAMFSGIMTRPSEIPIFWIFMYWVTPGHYIFEGIFMSQYENDNTPIEALPGSPFFMSLGCTNSEEVCMGTAEGWVQSSFSDWSTDSIPWNILYLIVLVATTRFLTFVGLKSLDYRAN